MGRYSKIAKKFWSSVERGSKHDCWKWIGGYSGNGYGKFYMNNRQYRAPRAAYELARGPIPEGLQVLHNCDNPQCVNPGHLRLGTHADNMADKMAKGRHGGVSRRLSAAEREALLTKHQQGGCTVAQLAQEFDITPRAVAYHIHKSRVD